MWAALIIGCFGLAYFAKAPAGGARVALDTTGHSRIDFSAIAIVRLALALAAAVLLVLACTFAATAFGELFLSRLNLGRAGMAIAALLAAAYGVWCILRFRAALETERLAGQVFDAAARFASGSFGFFLALAIVTLIANAAADHDSPGNLAAFAALLPAFCLATGGAIAFAHRTQLAAIFPFRPILRAALFAQAGGGIVGAVLVFGTAALNAVLLPDLAGLISFLMAGVACGLIAYASAANARPDTANFRRAALSYGGVMLMLLSVQVPIAWAGTFAMGERLIQTWSILILIMPFVFLATTALSLWILAFGGRLYRKATT